MSVIQIELDLYRDRYDSLTFAQHRAMYELIETVYPEQSFWNANACMGFMLEFAPRNVLEIGGHDGGLAAAVLAEMPFIDSWRNLELVVSPQVCEDPRYSLEVLDDWAWTQSLGGDALVMSHFIEHISETQLERLLANLDVRCIYVDAPLLEDTPSYWGGTTTAHVLPFSFAQLDQAFGARGYHAQKCGETIRWYSRKSSSA